MNKEITVENLKLIGFKKTTYIDDEGVSKTYYKLDGEVNDCFYFNPKEKVYKLYYKTTLGGGANHVHLDIEKMAELVLVLQVFQIKHDFFNPNKDE